MKAIILLLFLCFSVDSYGMARKYSQNEQVQRTIHGASESIDKGRIDTADLILTEGKRLVPAPKKPIIITPLKDKSGQDLVVLPTKLSNSKVVFRDSGEFKKLLEDRKTLRRYEEGEKGWKKFSETVDTTIRTKEQEKAKLAEELEREKKKSLSFWTLIKISIGILLGFAVLIILFLVLKVIEKVAGFFKK